MPLKLLGEVSQADLRFATDMMLDGAEWRTVTFGDHHALVRSIEPRSDIPDDVQEAFDRARNALLYAWFYYELLVVAETQAFSALELGLKVRLRCDDWNMKSRSLRHLTKEARQRKLMPPETDASSGMLDEMEMLAHLRNDLAHGTGSLHSPAMVLPVFERCAAVIDCLYSAT